MNSETNALLHHSNGSTVRFAVSPKAYLHAPKRFLLKAKRVVANDEFKMRSTSYWLETARIRSFPALNRDISVDILVIGGGITGITTAYHLKQSGLTVALIERTRLATRDTGHTTAHLTYVTDTRLHTLAKNLGVDHAGAAWDAGAAALDEIEALVQAEKIDCEFRRLPAYLHVPLDRAKSGETAKLKEDADLAQKMGFDAGYLDSIPHFWGAGNSVRQPSEISSAKISRGIDRDNFWKRFARFRKDGGQGIRRRKAPRQIEWTLDQLRSRRDRNKQSASRTLPAWRQRRCFRPSSRSTAVTFSGRAFRAVLVPDGHVFWDTNEPYDYLRDRPTRRFRLRDFRWRRSQDRSGRSRGRLFQQSATSVAQDFAGRPD